MGRDQLRVYYKEIKNMSCDTKTILSVKPFVRVVEGQRLEVNELPFTLDRPKLSKCEVNNRNQTFVVGCRLIENLGTRFPT